MRHLKNEVDTVKKDVECGLQLADKSVDVEAGDRIICYTMKTEAQNIDWNPGFWNGKSESNLLLLLLLFYEN